MSASQQMRYRIVLTALVTLATMALLAWEHAQGGVVRHHIFGQADMPSVSNWWGLIVLPALTWFLSAHIMRRVSTSAIAVATGFALPLVLGGTLSMAFTLGLASLTFNIFMGIFLLSVILPAYRAECILGFVLGMTFTFGGIIPLVIASVLTAISALIHLVVIPQAMHFWRQRT